ncbi:MAG: hypothetical protein JXB26_00895 [Candidatus Aminicenantes bacterium]|nr:hypothetical protein [Candidatus Aminicenantes bacterium]
MPFSHKKRIICLPALALFLLLVSCDYSYDVESDVGSLSAYCQKQSHWCGAAAAQMIIHFCCSQKPAVPVTPSWQTADLTSNQNTIHSWMQDYQVNTAYISSPYKHPDAVKGAIMSLKESAPGSFSVFHNNDGERVLHDMFYWMKRMGYPSATLQNGGHWIVVYRYTTDSEPESNNTVNLKNIGIINPGPPPSDHIVVEAPSHKVPVISSEGWYGGYWAQGVSITSWMTAPYYGEYAAVVEPPNTRGKVRVEKMYTGKTSEILSKEEAVNWAAKHVKKYNLTKHKELSCLKKSQPLQALLAYHQEQKRFYYIVPFAPQGQERAGALLILNPYNGNYHECAALDRPFRFLSKNEAVNLTMAETGAKEFKTVDANLKYIYSDLSYSHFYPFWEVKVDGKAFYVVHSGKVFDSLSPLHKTPEGIELDL